MHRNRRPVVNSHGWAAVSCVSSRVFIVAVSDAWAGVEVRVQGEYRENAGWMQKSGGPRVGAGRIRKKRRESFKLSRRLCVGARGGTRTHTPKNLILSQARLPIPPLGRITHLCVTPLEF